MKTLIPATGGRYGSPSKCCRRDRSGCGITLDGIATTRRRTAIEFFTAGTSRLLAVEEQAGVGHHVVLSIVGVDKVDSGYYVGKRRQGAGPRRRRPGDGLAATQFHEFAGQILDWRWGLAGAVATVLIQILRSGWCSATPDRRRGPRHGATGGHRGQRRRGRRLLPGGTRRHPRPAGPGNPDPRGTARRHAAEERLRIARGLHDISGTLWPRSACRPASACT